jgi:thiol-disulfide isomerase/thioredoxin
MKNQPLLLFIAAALALPCPAAPADAPTPAASSPALKEGDAQWQAIEDAMNALREPKDKPKSEKELKTALATGLAHIDELSQQFLKQHPADPRRWRLRIFDGITEHLRAELGLPEKGTLSSIVSEILNASDADGPTRDEASAVNVLVVLEEVEAGKVAMEDWQKLARAHLKDHPDSPRNRMIEGQLAIADLAEQKKPNTMDLKFKATDGSDVDLSKLRGKVVLIDFWATWCGPCVAEIPNVVSAYEKLHSKGFEIIGISLDQDEEKLAAFTKSKGMTWPQYFDGKGWTNEISTRFGITSIPTMWLVNKKGVVVDTNARGHLEAQVEKLLSE